MATRALRFVWVLAALGCVAPPTIVEDEDSSDETCEFTWTSQLSTRAIDILVVVDGSPGSQGAQARLAAGLDSIVATLEASAYPLDYRIAVTTTDMGPPACDPALTTPEFGEFVGSSCRARLGDFVDPLGEDHSALCTDRCSLDSLGVIPTYVAGEPEPAPRRWIERDGVEPNLPAGVGLDEAVRCLALAGVGGCAFESPFAAIQAAYVGSSTPGHPNFGFFRGWARRFIIVVSDASECSWTPVGVGIFDPDGERAFWSDAQADAPTPAVCWNAGTRCETFDGVMECFVGHYDLTGTPNGFPDQVVLQGTIGIAAALTELDYSWETEYRYFLGVPVEGVEFLEFGLAEDPAFQLEFGTAPGCEGPDGTVGLPPVRTLEVIDRLNSWAADFDELVGSVCAEDFRPMLEQFGADMVEVAGRPGCVSGQLCDVVPDTPELDIDCRVEAGWPWSLDYEDLPECARDSDGAYLIDPSTGSPAMPGPEHQVCHLLRLDADGLTPDPWDDMDPACVTEGANIQVELVTLDGRVTELQVSVSCAHPAD